MLHSTLTKHRKAFFFKNALYFFNIRFIIVKAYIWNALAAIPYYISSPRLLFIDISLFFFYFGFSAYKIHRRYMEALGGHSPDAYGDTPLKTLQFISKTARITSSDHCLDLGCGIGRIGFAWNLLYKCKYTGVDINPIFIKRAKILSHFFRMQASFLCKDMRNLDMTDYSVVYLYGSLYTDEFIEQVYKKLLYLKKGAKVITVSYSLEAWDHNSHFMLTDMFTAKFPWGIAQVFISEKIKAQGS